jgi:hypothetical protein
MAKWYVNNEDGIPVPIEVSEEEKRTILGPSGRHFKLRRKLDGFSISQKRAARNAVKLAISRGFLVSASTLICHVCGQAAEHWHHHKGYAKENLLEVIPVCVLHHRRLDKSPLSEV